MVNAFATQSAFRWRWILGLLACGAVAPFLGALTASPPIEVSNGEGGASFYTPTRGEWLCLLLNSRQALSNSEKVPSEVVVHYLYDRAKPDVVRIQVSSVEGTSKDQIRNRCARAEFQAIEAAKIYGWQNWLKLETEQGQRSVVATAEGLIR